jgi:hypothetical protein
MEYIIYLEKLDYKFATENTYSKNSLVIPKKFSIYRSCIKSSIVIEVLKYNYIVSPSNLPKTPGWVSGKDAIFASPKSTPKKPRTRRYVKVTEI